MSACDIREYIGMRMAYWAAPATRGMEVVDILGPLLKTLRDTTGETACFFKAEQHYRVCVAMADTHHALRREMHLGKIVPLYAGSAGSRPGRSSHHQRPNPAHAAGDLRVLGGAFAGHCGTHDQIDRWPVHGES
ncbi:hypothetical protein [Arthrobacter sp. yr096]|uniref:hypothetical protein n=1 Tax=Arthrobacter sp. yr096 TaxID=1761750 RepID=UPI00210A4212|nr:hypothetical protein [Arthrobacter sp. yr096]